MDPWGLNAVSISKGALSMIVIDTMTPDPTDAALPKWIAYGGLELPQQVSLHHRRAIHVQENAKKKKKRKKCLDAIADNNGYSENILSNITKKCFHPCCCEIHSID